MKKYYMEFIGTFFLVLVIALSGQPVVIGLVVAALVYIGAIISGSHYNPAVTIALLLKQKISGQEAFFYIVTQLLGALLACIVSTSVFEKSLTVAANPNVSLVSVLIAEALFTFLLVTAVFQTAVSKKTKGNSYFGLAIGGVVAVGASTVGSISGGAFNPAVGLAPIIEKIIMNPSSFTIFPVLLYTIGPTLGAVMAVMFFNITEE